MTMEKQKREEIRFDWKNRSENNMEGFSASGCGKGDIWLLKVRKTQALCTEDKMTVRNTVCSHCKVPDMKLKIWALYH